MRGDQRLAVLEPAGLGGRVRVHLAVEDGLVAVEQVAVLQRLHDLEARLLAGGGLGPLRPRPRLLRVEPLEHVGVDVGGVVDAGHRLCRK